MAKKSGTPVNAVQPAKPEAVDEADNADPGRVAKIKEGQKSEGKGKYGDKPEKQHKPDEKDDEKKETSWIEIEMVGEDDKPIPGVSYKIKLPDDSVASGTLNEKGFARVEGFKKGTCKVCFPDIDEAAWEKI